jgi:hypothetical protein
VDIARRKRYFPIECLNVAIGFGYRNSGAAARSAAGQALAQLNDAIIAPADLPLRAELREFGST